MKLYEDMTQEEAAALSLHDEYCFVLVDQIGVPYGVGGISLKGTAHPNLDCSGLEFASAAKCGITIPRTTEDMYAPSAALETVPAAQSVRGDIWLLDVSTDTQAQPAHCATYWNGSGSQAFIEAPHTGLDVKYSYPLAYPLMKVVRIKALYASQPAPAPAPTGSQPTISLGATGLAVFYLQSILDNHAGQKIVQDGVFGPNTLQAVLNMQRFFKLTADGIVGPATWAVLNYLNAQ